MRALLPYALHDKALLLSTLTFAAAYLEILASNARCSSSLSYKGNAIRAINANLQYRKKAISNSSIGAVLMLAVTEVCCDFGLLPTNLAEEIFLRIHRATKGTSKS